MKKISRHKICSSMTAIHALAYRLHGNMLLLSSNMQWGKMITVVHWMGIIAVHVAVKIDEKVSVVSLNLGVVASSKTSVWRKRGSSRHDNSCLETTYTPQSSLIRRPCVFAFVELASQKVPLCPIGVPVWWTCCIILKVWVRAAIISTFPQTYRVFKKIKWRHTLSSPGVVRAAGSSAGPNDKTFA